MLFCNLVGLLLCQNCVKGLRVTKIVYQIKFEVVWSELEAKNCFQRQSFTEYLRQTLVFVWNSTLQEEFHFYFPGHFCYYWQNFHFRRRTKHQAIILWSFNSEVVRHHMRQLVSSVKWICLGQLLKGNKVNKKNPLPWNFFS